jgi:thioredoxin reductase (NADPH)
VAGSSDLAKRLGAETNGNRIVVDEDMASTVPGVFAAGDCTGGMSQIAKAVYDGARAGTAAVKYVRSLRKPAHG